MPFFKKKRSEKEKKKLTTALDAEKKILDRERKTYWDKNRTKRSETKRNWRLKFIQFTHEWIVCNLFCLLNASHSTTWMHFLIAVVFYVIFISLPCHIRSFLLLLLLLLFFLYRLHVNQFQLILLKFHSTKIKKSHSFAVWHFGLCKWVSVESENGKERKGKKCHSNVLFFPFNADHFHSTCPFLAFSASLLLPIFMM